MRSRRCTDRCGAPRGVLNVGVCSNNSNHLCIEDVNCTSNASTGTCGGETFNPSQTVPAVVGSGIGSGADLEASQLSGVKFVGAFPALDAPELGDVVNTYHLDWE